MCVENEPCMSEFKLGQAECRIDVLMVLHFGKMAENLDKYWMKRETFELLIKSYPSLKYRQTQRKAIFRDLRAFLWMFLIFNSMLADPISI